MTQQNQGRFVWADICRLVAMLGVIIIHVAAPVFYNYKNISHYDFMIAAAIDSVVRVAVPLFAMLSGALLLGRDMSNGVFGVFSRVAKVAIPLAFWSIIYVFWMNYWEGKPLSLLGALLQALEGPVIYHLWFVYMTIGVYLILPIIQVLSVAMLDSKRWTIYFFGVWFFVNSITIYFPLEVIPHLTLLEFLKWPGYFLLGFYLIRSDAFNRIGGWMSFCVFALASLATFLITWRLSVLSDRAVETALEYSSPNVLIAAISAFHAIRKIKLPDALVRPTAFLSSIVFPVYLMHLLVIEFIKGGVFGFQLNVIGGQENPFFEILALSLIAFLISISFACVLRFIPGSSKLVG